jgi:hypothetical protein
MNVTLAGHFPTVRCQTLDINNNILFYQENYVLGLDPIDVHSTLFVLLVLVVVEELHKSDVRDCHRFIAFSSLPKGRFVFIALLLELVQRA